MDISPAMLDIAVDREVEVRIVLQYLQMKFFFQLVNKNPRVT